MVILGVILLCDYYLGGDYSFFKQYMFYGSCSCNAMFFSCIYVDWDLGGQKKNQGLNCFEYKLVRVR